MINSTTQTLHTSFDKIQLEEIIQKISAEARHTEHHPEGLKKEFQWLREAGILEIVLPGRHFDFNTGNTAGLLAFLKDMGKANLSLGRIFEGHINTLYLIHLYADNTQRKRWYHEVETSGYLFGVWNTQEADGISLEHNGNALTIQGAKTFCSGAGLVDRALITGNIDNGTRKGWQMTIIDMHQISDKQIDRESWKPLGMKASHSYKIDFSGYQLSEDELLGIPGIYLKQPYFNGGAIRFAAVHLGGAEAIAEQTLNYLKGLNRTDDPIQRLRISNIMTQLVAGRLWLAQAGTYFDQWVTDPENEAALIAFANMTRVSIEEICLQIMQESNKCVGARGLMQPYDLERLHRDLTFYLRQPAPDATRLNVADFFIKHQDAFNESVI